MKFAQYIFFADTCSVITDDQISVYAFFINKIGNNISPFYSSIFDLTVSLIRGFFIVLILKQRKIYPAKISKSALIRANGLGKDFEQAYVFVRTLSFKSKHPIILNYKAQLTLVRQSIGYTDSKFRKLMNLALKYKLATIQGKHLKLHSGNQDWQFKPSKYNDYRVTSDVEKLRQLILIEHYHNSQIAQIKIKEKQTRQSAQKGVEQNFLSEYNNQLPNHNITLSCLGLSKLLHLNSTSKAKRIIDCLAKQKLIVVHKITQTITQDEFKRALQAGNKKIRYNNSRYYRVMASVIELKYNLKRIKDKSAYDYIPEWAKVVVADKGYSKEYIDRRLVA